MKIFLHSFCITLALLYNVQFIFRGFSAMFSFNPTPSTFECVLYVICGVYVITFAVLNIN